LAAFICHPIEVFHLPVGTSVPYSSGHYLLHPSPTITKAVHENQNPPVKAGQARATSMQSKQQVGSDSKSPDMAGYRATSVHLSAVTGMNAGQAG
jgi:hypothetical protein